MSEIDILASWIESLTFEALPEAVTHAASRCILDTVSAAAGASGEPLLNAARREYLRLGIPSGEQRSSVWGTTESTTLFTAALLNGMAGHYFELDDVHSESKTHIGTVIIPAAYAMAEHLGSSGKDLICAVVSGYETTARIGKAFGVVSHRSRGWHSTSTAGVFGAAAACAKLLGLAGNEIASALGLAGTQAFGRWAFLEEGASCKVLHAGRAAEIGCQSAILAKTGMTGPHNILTAKDGGLLSGMSDSFDAGAAARGLGTVWEILNMDNKPYPCCRSTHCAIDAARAYYAEHNGSVENVSEILIETYEVGKKQCAESRGSLRPTTKTEAKFSTPYVVACALLTGNVGLSELEEKMIARREARILEEKVKVIATDRFSNEYPTHWGCKMTIFQKDGSSWETVVPDASGGRDVPLTDRQLKEKSRQLLDRVAGLDIEALQKGLMDLSKYGTLPPFASFFNTKRN